jgi:hypothetical protein
LGIAEATRAKKMERPKTSDASVSFFIQIDKEIKYFY